MCREQSPDSPRQSRLWTFNAIVLASAMVVVFSISPRGLTGNLIKRPAQTARIGTSLRFGGIEWSEAPINVVLAITTGCTYCQESAPFYKALTGWATQHRKVRVI